MGWAVSATPRPPQPGKEPVHWADLDGYGKFRLHRDSTPGRSSPYRVARPTTFMYYIYLWHINWELKAYNTTTRYSNTCVLFRLYTPVWWWLFFRSVEASSLINFNLINMNIFVTDSTLLAFVCLRSLSKIFVAKNRMNVSLSRLTAIIMEANILEYDAV